MDAETLRATQAPLKERYRNKPEAAVVTLEARGMLDEVSIACKLETGSSPPPASIRPPSAQALNCAPATCCWKRWLPVPA